MKRLVGLLVFALAMSGAAAEPQPVRLLIGGDVMFGRMTTDGYRSHAASELGTWRKALAAADVGLLNLETAICESGRGASKLPVLWATPDRLDELGTNVVVSIANNHAYDCGNAGVDETVAHLEARKLAHVGGREPGARLVGDDLVVLATTMHPPPYYVKRGHVHVQTKDEKRLIDEVAAARAAHPKRAIVVSIHWGKERSDEVAAWQRTFAWHLVQSGATVVAGHGPHTAQKHERIGDALVFYSLGNLAFDDGSPVGRPVPPKLVHLSRTKSSWRAEVAEPVW